MITVRELKEKLNGIPDNAIVIIQKDAEGNYYSPLYEMYEGKYIADTKWSGEVRTDSDDGDPCVALVPVN